jgi:hypothetical protein
MKTKAKYGCWIAAGVAGVALTTSLTAGAGAASIPGASTAVVPAKSGYVASGDPQHAGPMVALPAATPSTMEPHPAIAPPGANLPAATSRATAATYCVFYTRFDDVHWSSTAGDVSGHGWWENGNCPAGTKADITTRLEEYYSDGTWKTKNTGTKKKAYANGGSANRANARVTCQGHNTVSWRTETDINLINIPDSNNIGRSATYNLPCSVK